LPSSSDFYTVRENLKNKSLKRKLTANRRKVKIFLMTEPEARASGKGGERLKIED
jgi:hypothetical protein